MEKLPSRVITELLALARQGQTQPDRSTIQLTDLIENCWQNVQTKDGSILVETDLTISADESRLRQLFENLIRNSVQHGGSAVTITVGDLDNGFYIEDDGPGIPSDEINDIFMTGHSTSEHGTGFGLSIVKQIVESHGWKIHVTEGTNSGARFEVTGVESVAR